MQYALRLDGAPELAVIRARLLAVRGRQRDADRLAPLSQLVYGILSARTTDVVSWAAFERLGRHCRSWKDLCRAQPRDIEAIIRPVTFAEKKAHYLPQALRTIARKRGDLDLRFLACRTEEDGMTWLRGLTGVDAKIAATVLNFSTLRKRVLAVDTHLLRLGKRLGVLSPKADYKRGYAGYMRLIPNEWDADDLYELHWLLKKHGQEVCFDARPACPACVLRDLCASRA